MQAPHTLVFRWIFSASLLLLTPLIALGGGSDVPAQPKPKADAKNVKVWTNEELEVLGPLAEPANRPGAAQTEPPAETSAVALPPEKDPRWYAQQLAALNDELSGVTQEEDQLRHFRETGTGLPTGMNVVLPCNGITTDNRIAQLEARRQEILQELDDLADIARVNDMPPGILVEGRGLVSAEIPLTAEQQKEALLERYESLTGQLEEIQVTLAGMREAADANRSTLLQPDPRWGGSPTTNLLENLYQQQSVLESEIESAQDQMRRAGVPLP